MGGLATFKIPLITNPLAEDGHTADAKSQEELWLKISACAKKCPLAELELC